MEPLTPRCTCPGLCTFSNVRFDRLRIIDNASGMTKFKKTVLLEDRTYYSPDGKLVVNPESKRHWVDKFAHFKASLFDIPAFWDHSNDPKLSQPIKRKDGKRLRAKGQAGWLTNAAIADDGGLELEFDIPNEKDAQQVADNLTKVSPVIWDTLSDGRGVTHESVIGACDLVVHPVDDSQTNFVPVPAIACSLVRMSLDGKPVIYRLADHEDDDSDHNSDHESDDEANGDGSDEVRLVIEGLAALNIILPDDTDKENFWERAPSAIMTAKAMGDDGVNNEPLEATSPEFAAFSLSPLGKFQSKGHQKGVMARLDAILREGRCTPVEYKDRAPQVQTIRLSLNAEGEHKLTAIEEWIKSREDIPVGSCWDVTKRTRMSNLEVVPHPDGLAGDEVTEEQAEEIVDEIFA